MGVITISRGSYSRGKEIAEKLARKLGYDCISREVLLAASKEFDIPEVKLTQAIEYPPSFFEKLLNGKKKYITFIRKAFLEKIQQDNIVYHGFAGHFFAQDIPNILRVRIIADTDYRIQVVMDRDKVSEDEARQILHKVDSDRRKWSMHLYGMDTHSAELYDVVLRIDCLQVDAAVTILYKMAKRPCFQTNEGTRKKLQELLDAASNEFSF